MPEMMSQSAFFFIQTYVMYPQVRKLADLSVQRIDTHSTPHGHQSNNMILMTHRADIGPDHAKLIDTLRI